MTQQRLSREHEALALLNRGLSKYIVFNTLLGLPIALFCSANIAAASIPTSDTQASDTYADESPGAEVTGAPQGIGPIVAGDSTSSSTASHDGDPAVFGLYDIAIPGAEPSRRGIRRHPYQDGTRTRTGDRSRSVDRMAAPQERPRPKDGRHGRQHPGLGAVVSRTEKGHISGESRRQNSRSRCHRGACREIVGMGGGGAGPVSDDATACRVVCSTFADDGGKG